MKISILFKGLVLLMVAVVLQSCSPKKQENPLLLPPVIDVPNNTATGK